MQSSALIGSSSAGRWAADSDAAGGLPRDSVREVKRTFSGRPVSSAGARFRCDSVAEVEPVRRSPPDALRAPTVRFGSAR